MIENITCRLRGGPLDGICVKIPPDFFEAGLEIGVNKKAIYRIYDPLTKRDAPTGIVTECAAEYVRAYP